MKGCFIMNNEHVHQYISDIINEWKSKGVTINSDYSYELMLIDYVIRLERSLNNAEREIKHLSNLLSLRDVKHE